VSPREAKRLSRVAGVEDLREMARRKLPRPIFDFIDGAAFRERTLAANVEDFGRIRFRQRVLRDVSSIDLSTRVLGQPMSMPVAIAPTGISGILPVGGHGELIAARVAKAAGIPYTLGMMATASIEEIANAVASPWYQLCMLRDRGIVRGMVERAKLAGCPVLVLRAASADAQSLWLDPAHILAGHDLHLRTQACLVAARAAPAAPDFPEFRSPYG
jgi:L-lactate dehydrogenase (cytochrome)